MMAIEKRYDFVLFFDVKDGNPNGDPDAGNLPRIDTETNRGLVTDVCLKRKVRNYVQMAKGAKPPYDIFIKEKAVLNTLIEQAHDQKSVSEKQDKKEKTESARQWMCATYYDIRTFGAVMTTGKPEKQAGQVRGPVQLTFARSIEPIIYQEHTITRMAVTNEADAGKERTMGRKSTVPYGLYRAYGFVSASLAAQTGFSKDDLNLFWEALLAMFDHDHSAARGLMTTRCLIVFEHGTALGNSPAHELFERICCKRSTEGPARDFTDYSILLDGKPINERMKTIPVS
jgi:CRISPR-associated protein Csd2